MSEWVESRKIENMNEWEFLNPPLGLINYWPFWVKTKTNLVHIFFIGSLYNLENIKYFSKNKEKQNHQTNQNRIWLLSLGWRIINLNFFKWLLFKRNLQTAKVCLLQNFFMNVEPNRVIWNFRDNITLIAYHGTK